MNHADLRLDRESTYRKKDPNIQRFCNYGNAIRRYV